LDASVTEDDDGLPIKFSLNLRGLIKGHWNVLIRYDNAHGESHRHHSHPFAKDETHPFMAVVHETFIEAAETDLVQNAEEYLADFEHELEAITGEPHDESGDDDEEHPASV
jgi:hypothetical protein